MRTSQTIRSGPLFCRGMCAQKSGGVKCLICGRFASKPGKCSSHACSRRVGGVFTKFRTRNIGRFILSLHCGKNKCRGSTGVLTKLLVPRTSQGGIFTIFSSGGKRSCSGSFYIRAGKATNCLGLGSGQVCVLADRDATSSSRIIVGDLGPFVSIALVNRLARKGGMKVRVRGGSGCR